MLKFTLQKLSTLCLRLAAISLVLPGVALAALPKPEAPSRGKDRGSCKPSRTSAMTERCSSRYSSAWLSFWESPGIPTAPITPSMMGKKWSDLGAGVAVGIGLLILIIYLVTKATTIM